MSPIRAARNGLEASWRIVPLRAALAVFAAWVAYLVVVNLLFVTGAARAMLNRLAPEHVHFEWSSAWSPYPFRVHTNGFVLTGHDSSVAWRLAFDHAEATFDLHDFFEHRVHLRGASASGVVVDVRQKPHPPSGPGGGKKWSVALDDCVAEDVREVSVDAVRVTDRGGVARGGFTFEPHRRVDVRPSTYHARSAAVSLRGGVLATDVTGDYTFAIDDHRIGGGPVAPQIDASAAGRASTGDLRALSRDLSGGEGSLELRARVVRGRIQNGSMLRATSERWLLVGARDAVLASSRLGARVESDVLTAKLETTHASIARDGWVIARIPALGALVRSRDLDLARSPNRWTASVDVPAATLPHLEELNRYFGSRLFSQGSARFSLHADFAPHVASEVTVAVRDVTMKGESGWWMTATASPVRYSLEGAPWLRGVFAGRMRDATLPLAVLGASKAVRKLAPGGKYTFRGDVRAGDETFALTHGELQGSSLHALGHYHHDARGDRGAALVEAHDVPVGVRITRDGTELVPLASRAWYDGTR